jgi:hypothetical protein
MCDLTLAGFYLLSALLFDAAATVIKRDRFE